MDHLPILSGIQSAELHRLEVTLFLAYYGALDPACVHMLHGLLSGSSVGWAKSFKLKRQPIQYLGFDVETP